MTRKIVAAVATTAIAAGAGIGVAQAQNSESGTSGTTGTKQQRDQRRGPSTAQLQKLASALGVTTAQLKTALQDIRPAKGERPARGDRTDYAAAIAAELGVETAAVQKILDANRPERPARGAKPPKPPTSASSAAKRAGKPPKRDNTKLIAALASGLNKDSATAKAAVEKVDAAQKAKHDAEHKAREAAFAKALAEKLNLDVAKVTEALESTNFRMGGPGHGGPGGPGRGGPGGPGGPPPSAP